MDPFTIALLGTAAVSAFGGMRASSQGRRDMEQAAAQARAAQERAYTQSREALTTGRDQAIGYYNPLMRSGDDARRQYETSIGLHGRDEEQGWIDGMVRDPGYTAGLDEGRRAIDASAASRGMLHSGRTLKALQQHGYRYLTDAMDKRRAGYNPLMQAGQGATDAAARLQYGYGGDMSRLYQGEGQDTGNMYLGMGRQRAESRMAPINALTGTMSTMAQAYGYGRGRAGQQPAAPAPTSGWDTWTVGS